MLGRTKNGVARQDKKWGLGRTENGGSAGQKMGARQDKKWGLGAEIEKI
jgi:hypothetical protein